jgi:hypothetical protein
MSRNRRAAAGDRRILCLIDYLSARAPALGSTVAAAAASKAHQHTTRSVPAESLLLYYALVGQVRLQCYWPAVACSTQELILARVPQLAVPIILVGCPMSNVGA